MAEIVYSGRVTADGDRFHKTAVCPCADCVEFRWVMSPEGSAEIHRRVIEQVAKEQDQS